MNARQASGAERERPILAVLSDIDLGSWEAGAAVEETPGGDLPYGMQTLREEFRLSWTDAARGRGGVTRLARAVDNGLARWSPGLRGCPDALVAFPLTRRADAVVSVFEDAGLAYARVSAMARAAERAPAHVMVCCWLAEDCAAMSHRHLRSVQRSLAGVSRIVVFSANQTPILTNRLDVSADRIVAVPFGVDTSYYDPARLDAPPGGGGVVAVGSDSRRDYATLFEAARISGIAMTVACRPRNIVGLQVPAQVRIVSVYGSEYRRLLHSADLVVTPTLAPAYPSGQSVVLEAMSMGRATLTTDSPALREYVDDGRTGVLMPARDARGVAELLTQLMADRPSRESLGRRGAASVRENFDAPRMWRRISSVVGSLIL